MTIHLPNEVERSIEAAVQSGRFASVDAAMAEAARLLMQKLTQEQAGAITPASTEAMPDPLLGSMSDHAELMDQIVDDAMRNREQQPWRMPAGE